MIESITALHMIVSRGREAHTKLFNLIDITILQIILEHYLQKQIRYLLFAQD